MKNIKLLSIRARVAYGILCLEKALKIHSDKNETWEFVLGKLWQFTSSYYVTTWLSPTADLMPSGILESPYDTSDEDLTITLVEYEELRKIYKVAPQYILDILESIFECGTMDMYGELPAESPKTVELILSIRKKMIQNKIELPKMDGLKRYHFKEQHGWGITFERKDIFLK